MSRQPAHQAVPFPSIIPADVKCSICLEGIVDDNQKGICKLQCGHFFHLACVGVAFNVKGAMVCPNCREVEDSEWKYSHGNCTHIQPTNDGEDGIPNNDEMYRAIRQSIDNVLTYYNDNSHDMYQGFLPTNGSLFGDQSMEVGRMFGSFPYDMTFEVPSLFDFVGDGRSSIRATPYVNFRQNTYVGLYMTEDGSIGYGANPPSMSRSNNLDYYRRLLQNSNAFGTSTGSPGVRTSPQGGILSNPPNIRSYLNIQPLLDLPSSSTPPNMGQGLHCNWELNTHTPEVLYHGTSSSAASAGSTELGLNMSIDGGSLYDPN